MKRTIITLTFIFVASLLQAQTSFKKDSTLIKSIYNTALLNGKSYDWLDHLSNEIGGRLSGSYNAEKAVKYTQTELEEFLEENSKDFIEYSPAIKLSFPNSISILSLQTLITFIFPLKASFALFIP